MGGWGSTRWAKGYRRKTTVEECFPLTVKHLLHDEETTPASAIRILRWKDGHKGQVVLTAQVTLHLDRGKGLRCTIRHPSGYPSQMIAQVISIEFEMSACGVRRWLTCPTCSKRCAKLYRPPYRLFGCRGCNALTYLGCQQHTHDQDEEALRILRRIDKARARIYGGCVTSLV